MHIYEGLYAAMIERILKHGERRQTRNAVTLSTFGETIKIDLQQVSMPLIQGRQMYPQGIFGEFAAFVRGPKTVADFEEFGCNYWKQWADKDGNLNLDYGNTWSDYNGFNQLAQVKDMLINDPTNRRMIIDAWRPDRLEDLSLPCCHYAYQFYLRDSKYLDMVWIQRSVDMMIGLPSDFVLAALFVRLLAHELNLRPGVLTFQLGDCHVYEEHVIKAEEYIDIVRTEFMIPLPIATIISDRGTAIEQFVPDDILITSYEHYDPITFKLHG